jgi:hypothetical protein
MAKPPQSRGFFCGGSNFIFVFVLRKSVSFFFLEMTRGSVDKNFYTTSRQSGLWVQKTTLICKDHKGSRALKRKSECRERNSETSSKT